LKLRVLLLPLAVPSQLFMLDSAPSGIPAPVFASEWPPARGGAAPWLPLSEHWHEHSHGGTVAASLSTVHRPVASDLRLPVNLTFKLLAARKSDLCNHQAIVQPRLFDCLMVSIIIGYADHS
jgi:hypothetical protein